MNLAGAIHAAGSRPLKDFLWGECIVNMVNSLVADIEPPVTLETTGKYIIDLLDKLPDKQKNLILSYPVTQVDETGEFIIETHNGEVNTKSEIIALVGITIVVASIIITMMQSAGKPTDFTLMTAVINGFVDIVKTIITTK